MEPGEGRFVQLSVLIPEVAVLAGAPHGGKLAVEHDDVSQLGVGHVGGLQEELVAQLFSPDIERRSDVSPLVLVGVARVDYHEVRDVLREFAGENSHQCLGIDGFQIRIGALDDGQNVRAGVVSQQLLPRTETRVEGDVGGRGLGAGELARGGRREFRRTASATDALGRDGVGTEREDRVRRASSGTPDLAVDGLGVGDGVEGGGGEGGSGADLSEPCLGACGGRNGVGTLGERGLMLFSRLVLERDSLLSLSRSCLTISAPLRDNLSGPD